MLNVVVCDDDQYYRHKISSIVEKYFYTRGIIYTITLYDSGINHLNLKEKINDYNIIFLDICMEHLSGFELAKRIRRYSEDIYIVFITASMEYSLEGYKVNAIRYLLKNNDDLEINLFECLNSIINKMKNIEVKQVFNFQEGKIEVLVNNIIYVESNLHKLIIYIKANKKVVKCNMYEKLNNLESNITSNCFCRIHQSFLVNLNYVKSLKKYAVVLYDNKELSVAKSRYKGVKDAYILHCKEC